jgi:hypothetical protein
MDPTEKYGRWIVNGDDGFLYMGIGTAKTNVAVYDTCTGQMREVLPQDAQIVDTARTYIGVDGKVYTSVGKRLFTLTGFNIREIDAMHPVPMRMHNILCDARMVDLEGHEGMMILRDPKSQRETSLKIGYEGEPQEIFRIGFGPDGALYGSSILPAHLVHVDLANHTVENVGTLGGGELYSLLAHGGCMAMGAYAGLSPLMSYDPAKPFQPSDLGNPSFADFAGSDGHWRPQAMIEGPGGMVYVAGTAGYGQLEGPLVVWDGASARADAYGNLVHNQSVTSLAVWNGHIVGGTTTQGGGGGHPTETDDCVFLWDAVEHKLVWKVVPVAGAKLITDLITSQSGIVYGIAVSRTAHTLFALEPKTQSIVATQELPYHSVPYNSVISAADGTIWGLGDQGVFRIDDRSHRAEMVARSPVRITAGIGLRGHQIYFAANSEIYRYNEVTDGTK